MNAPDALQNIRSKHPVAYLVLYLFVGWALLVVITHAIAFGAELLIASSDQPVVKWETTDERTDGTRTVYYDSPSLYQEVKVKIKDSKIVDAEPGAFLTIGAPHRPATPCGCRCGSVSATGRRIASSAFSVRRCVMGSK